MRWGVRDFLIEFSSKLMESKLGMDLSQDLLTDLQAYDAALRSVNDKSSHESRYAILLKWFRIWSADTTLS